MSNVVNATNNFVDYVSFWVNRSEYNYTSYVVFKYFNGTHGKYYNASEPIDDRSWNYWQWWTDYDFYPTDLFNTTIPQELYFEIPRQNGNTTVVYRLTVAVWNGTGLEYNDYNGTYVVQYSDYEVLYEQNVYVTTGLYCASLPTLSGLIFVAWRIYKPEEEAEAEPGSRTEEEKHHLDESALIARSDHLDETIGDLRTGASLLLGIGAGGTLLSANFPPSIGVFLWMSFMSLSLCSFFGIVATFSSAKAESGGFELKRGLIPKGQTLDEYKSQLEEVIEQKEDIIGRIESAVGVGLVYLATLILMSFIVSFFPASEILGDRILSMIPVWIALGFALGVGLAWSYVALGPRGLRVLDE